MADFTPTIPSRGATLSAAAAISCIADPAVASASGISPAVQKAFDEWQVASARHKELELENEAAHERAYASLPEHPNWMRPISVEQQAVLNGALKSAGALETDEAASAAIDVSHAAFLRFVGTTPQTIADVRLQAKHLSDWCEDCDVEQPILDWLNALTTASHS